MYYFNIHSPPYLECSKGFDFVGSANDFLSVFSPEFRVLNDHLLVSMEVHFEISQPIPEITIKVCTMMFTIAMMSSYVVHDSIVVSGIGWVIHCCCKTNFQSDRPQMRWNKKRMCILPNCAWLVQSSRGQHMVCCVTIPALWSEDIPGIPPAS